ncbi:hypothetical protein I4U23_008579 [Adineta vaga]|nr:hypothetical protein I4U23_008579 [Adineta vaga]
MTDDNDYEQFLRIHEFQLVLNNIPKHLYRRLYEKMKNEIFDSGSYFQLCPVDDDEIENDVFNGERRYYVSTLENVILDPHTDENAIFLIDHAWTYRIKDARSNLINIPSLYERMASLMNIDTDTKEDGIEVILQRMWKYNQTYTLTSTQINPQQDCEEVYEPYWYIMDELGSSIRHSSTNANVCCTSFFFAPTQTMFSIFYPIVRIDQPYSEIFRNFVYDNKDTLDRSIRLLPWRHINNRKQFLRNLTIETNPELFNQKLENNIEIYEKCHQNDLYDKTPRNNKPRKIDLNHIWKVYTDHDLVKEHLNDPHYQLVDNPDQADILFLMKPIQDFRYETLGDKLINQFPLENIVTNKELLSLVARRWKTLFGSKSSDTDLFIDSQGSPPWLATTFNLTYELAQFAVYFQYREDQHLDNTWIIKPINLTRSIDMSVTNSFDMIVRLPESGPKIACKYVSSPILLQIPEIDGGVKFDVRYVLLLRSIRPLKLYIHKIFWLRFANKPFSLKELDDYETHFTVMNYRPNAFLRQMNCQTFISMYNEQYGQNKETWSIVEQRIYQMFREIFQCASHEEPPLGIDGCISSRALYAADLMLEMIDNQVQPKLLEINFTPDCHRACTFYPNFYNQVFNVLFSDVTDEQDVIDISV